MYQLQPNAPYRYAFLFVLLLFLCLTLCIWADVIPPLDEIFFGKKSEQTASAEPTPVPRAVYVLDGGDNFQGEDVKNVLLDPKE